MSFAQEFYSWLSPSKVETYSIPTPGSQAPPSSQITFPREDGKPVIITFLRHCGCPCMDSISTVLKKYLLISKVAEKTFMLIRKVSEARSDVHCIAVSHSDKAATDKWVEAVGGAGNVEIIVDHERKLYGQYGLGVASAWHVLNPWSMADVFKLAREERIKNRPTESGTRWQTAGTFAIDSHGEVQYVQVAQQASDNGDFDKALNSLEKP
jgi:peroxiredoxin